MIKSLHTKILIIVSLSSCGPRAQELAMQEKMRLDSVAMATEKAVLKRVNEEQEFLRITVERNERLTDLKQELSNAKAMYRNAKEELNVIKEFQFGRSISTKAVQVENQCIEIQRWEDEILRIESELNKI